MATYSDILEAALLDELVKIGGIKDFFSGGVKTIGNVLEKGKSALTGSADKGIFKHMGETWRKGADAAEAAKGSRIWGGVKSLAQSPYGQAIGTLAVPVGAGAIAGNIHGHSAERRRLTGY
jgi:hypothetical protein